MLKTFPTLVSVPVREARWARAKVTTKSEVMQKFFVLVMLAFAAIVAMAATVAPVPTAAECAMYVRPNGHGGLSVDCAQVACDLPGSQCARTEGTGYGGTLQAWCVCTGGESAGGACPGHGVWTELQGWQPYCGGLPCLGVGFCHPNPIIPLPVWTKACSCKLLPPVF